MSFDISSAVVGWAVFNIDPRMSITLTKSGWFKPYNKGDIFDNLTHLKQNIKTLLEQYKPDKVAIEDVISYMPRLSSARTIITLSLYNRTVGLTCYEYLKKSPELYSVMAIRHGIKTGTQLPTKEEIPSLVEKRLGVTLPRHYKKTGTLRSEIHDEADSIACGLFACLKLTNQLKTKCKSK